MPLRCNSCQGTYNTVQRDGTDYQHVCGPIPNPAFNLDPKAGTIDLRETIERPNKRDENLTDTDLQTKMPVIKSEGLGTTTVVTAQQETP